MTNVEEQITAHNAAIDKVLGILHKCEWLTGGDRTLLIAGVSVLKRDAVVEAVSRTIRSYLPGVGTVQCTDAARAVIKKLCDMGQIPTNGST